MASKTERKAERKAERDEDDDNGRGRGRGRRGRRDRPSRAEVRAQMMEGAGSVAGILATIVTVIALIAALIIVAYIVFVLFKGNMNNSIVKHVSDYAKDLAGPFKDLFSFTKDKKPQVKLTTVVNYGIAALVWVVVGRIIATLLRRIAP